jgi:hypothetical protein
VLNTNPAETLAASQAPSQSPLPIQHSIQAQVASPSPAQITALSTNPAETLVTNQTSSPSLVFNPSRTSSLVQNQEQGSTQSITQIVNAAAAPMYGDYLNPLPVAVAAQSGPFPTQSPFLSKPGTAGDGKASKPETLRSAQADGNVDSVQHASQQLTGHSSVTAVDASTMARTLAGTMNAPVEPAGTSRFVATHSDSREAFATLDTAGSPGATTWIHAGAQHAEAGYLDPVLGWVSVRADLSAGEVHAQLVPGSADAAQALGSHLTGLNTYLTEHHTPVETLTLSSPEGGGAGLGSGRGAGEGMQQGAGQGQQSAQNADASSPSGPNPEAVVQSQAVSAVLPAVFGEMNGSTQSANMGGSHISVMA